MAGRRSSPLWLARPTRFAALTKKQAQIGLVLLTTVIVAALATALAFQATHSAPGIAKIGSETDAQLYRSIVDGIRHGGHYYTVAATQLREGNYPLKPFIAFPLPTLAVVEGALSPTVVAALMLAVVIAAAMAWYVRLRPTIGGRGSRIALLALLAIGMAAFLQRDMQAFHEFWAGPLIALSLAVYAPGRGIEAITIALIALMIRETTAIYVLVMLLFAALEGRWRESAGWLFILAVFALVLGLHAHAVAAVVGPLDPVSPGWRGLLGFGYFIDSVKETTLLVLLPLWVDALVVALALFGWAAWNSPVGLRALVTIAGYAALLGLFAREGNVYWGLMIAPIVLLGLVFAPDGLRDLVTRARDRRRITVTRIRR
jgi:hypothetical protein